MMEVSGQVASTEIRVRGARRKAAPKTEVARDIPGRRRKPDKVMSPDIANGDAAANGRRKRNGKGLTVGDPLTITAPAVPRLNATQSGAGEVSASVMPSHVLLEGSTLAETIAAIREHHRQREVFLRAELRLNNQIKALIRRGLIRGDTQETNSAPSQAEEDGPELGSDDQNVRAESGPTADLQPSLDSPDFSSLATEPLRQAREYIKKFRMHHQKILVRLAEELPVYKRWVESVPGFGAMGLGQIVGEAGDLGNYPTVSKLWKRMGLAVIDGEAQRRCKDKAKAELHGFNPRRRSIMYSIGDAMVKGNATRKKLPDGVVEREAGKYRLEYLNRKAYERDRLPDATDMHIHRRGQRFMEKKLLKHLWQQWRKAV